MLNLNKFRHVSICSDVFENRMNCSNSCHIESEKFRQVLTCSDMFENPMNHNNLYHVESEKVWTGLCEHVQTCLRIL